MTAVTISARHRRPKIYALSGGFMMRVFGKRCSQPDSNRQPKNYEFSALTIEL